MSQTRPIREIAFEIQKEWNGLHPTHPALPYLGAMNFLDSIEDYYYYDSARSIISYFLANANGWRGEAARRIKSELRELIK